MAEEIRIWQVGEGDTLKEITRAPLNLEQRIECWLAKDIRILSPDLLVIGRQVQTDSGGYIDLLCLDSDANLVIVELKKDKTPREVTAQALDYGSWVKTLSAEEISDIALRHLDKPLEEAFVARFKSELPDVINERHSMVIVGARIDESSERIIKYLSDTYGVPINAATFGYFRDENGTELLARTFLVEPAEVQKRADQKAGTRVKVSFEELQAIADSNGVGSVYRLIKDSLSQWLYLKRQKISLTLSGDMADGSKKALINLSPDESNAENGLKYQIYAARVATFTGATEQQVLDALPKDRQPYIFDANDPELRGWSGFFGSVEDAQRFIDFFISNLKWIVGSNPQWRSEAAKRAWETRRSVSEVAE